MSQQDVERTLGRMLTDQAFREAFFQNPAQACLLFGIRLTQHETEALLRVPRSPLVGLGGRLDDRICRLHVRADEHPKRED